MRILLPLSGLVLGATMLSAQEAPETAPRVDAGGGAGGVEVILNEVNSDDYPAMRLFATVLQDGAPLTGLGAGDFRVREDEVDQQPLTVEEQLPALSVVVTFDTSGSMAGAMTEAQAAATAFVEGLDPQDSVQLVRFAREIETVTPMTSTKPAVTEAIATLAARGDTALYDAMLRSVELAAERRGRKAIVVLSDGVDDDGTGQPLSEATLDAVLDRAAEVNVPVFVVGLGDELDEAVLSQVAQATGGLYLPAPTPEELGEVYGRIGAQLSGQYAIGYTSSLPADGTARRVDLEAMGVQASKDYTPSGAAPDVAEAAPAAAPSGVCAPVEAWQAVEADLAQAQQRYEEDLIDVTTRNQTRSGAVEQIGPAFAQDISYDCAISGLEAIQAGYAGDLIDVTQRNGLRQSLATTVTESCGAEGTMEAVMACFELLGDAYDRDLIDVTQRNALRDRAVEPLRQQVLSLEDEDEALRRVNDLYERKLIDVTSRNQLREAILAGE